MSGNELVIHITASTFGELAENLAAVVREFEANGVSVNDTALLPDQPGVSGKVETKAKAKSKAKAKAEPEDTPAPEVSDKTVVDLTPAEAREKGIREMQTYFGANPEAMPVIRDMQSKFGVKMFSDIPDNQALDFYADVKLLVSGNAQTEAA